MAYVQKVKWMIEGPLAVDALVERMRVLQDLVRPWVEREQRSMFSLDQFSRSLSEDIRLGGPQQRPPPQTYRDSNSSSGRAWKAYSSKLNLNI